MSHRVFTRFPSNAVIKGVNLTARYSDVNATATLGQGTFGGPFGGASQTYDLGWFTNQMDVAVAVGANVVQITGDLELQIAGLLNGTTYLTRWDAVINAAATRNLYVIARGASAYQLDGVADSGGVITTTARNLLKDLYNTVRAHSNVIAFDCISESSAWVQATQGTDPYAGQILQAPITANQLVTVQQTVYNDLKGQSTDLPLTWGGCQTDYFTAAAFSNSTYWGAALPYSDYVDFHVYYEMAVLDLLPALTTINGKPILVGEFGQRAAGSFVGCSYAQMNRVLFNTGIDGVVCWSAVDSYLDPHANQDWGIANDDLTLRSKGTTFTAFPTTAEPTCSIFAPSANPRARRAA